ncbi:Na+/H+ antiporter subunit E [Azospirillum isscasi]|uniref:Na+/H+ antiporter subunit E n=1 Tax=Azospirillum isscasi TaxID=3053926 RepID=A0ABU0WMK6_9PROT|nr:Na+/H+ antiporter subunit E [Azospirillum isscasi]MDQ2105470.1 Na+/H+ antiporter subunit E [Azospirillum isscasi]
MRDWLPFPLLTAALVALWLLLTESVALGSILMGGVLALLTVRGFIALDPPAGRLRRPRAACALAALVLGDIARSNLAVARIILTPGKTERVSGFLRIPLDMRAPYGLATLACIITATPGTIWVEYNSANNTILLHILDLVDEGTWIDTIKGRYEKRLMEIFE